MFFLNSQENTQYVRKFDPKIHQANLCFSAFLRSVGGGLGNTLPQVGRYEEGNLQMYQVFSYK